MPPGCVEDASSENSEIDQLERQGSNMDRRSRRTKEEFQVFNVIYQDGSLSSNRRIATSKIDVFDADASIKAIIEAQDREIAERSARTRPSVKSVERVSRR